MAVKRTRTRADDKDQSIGLKIRERRIQLGLTQHQLAQLIGVTYQQAHKYERGVNRVSASRLHDISERLHVPIGYFFEGLESAGSQATTPRQRMCLEVSRNFSNIANDRHQEAVSQLVRALAGGAQGNAASEPAGLREASPAPPTRRPAVRTSKW
jgi:transcriptional regulator with XRE-family HTH domain